MNRALILIKVSDITQNEVGRGSAGSPGAQPCDSGDEVPLGGGH